MNNPTSTPARRATGAHRAPVRARSGPTRAAHGRRCACLGCHDAITVRAATGLAALEAWLRGNR